MTNPAPAALPGLEFHGGLFQTEAAQGFPASQEEFSKKVRACDGPFENVQDPKIIDRGETVFQESGLFAARVLGKTDGLPNEIFRPDSMDRPRPWDVIFGNRYRKWRVKNKETFSKSFLKSLDVRMPHIKREQRMDGFNERMRSRRFPGANW